MAEPTHIEEYATHPRDPDERGEAVAFCGYREVELRWDGRREGSWASAASDATCKTCREAYEKHLDELDKEWGGRAP